MDDLESAAAPSRPSSEAPEVSVIIPTYDRADLVGRAVRSVQAQTFEDWETIIVDDASTDRTPEVGRRLADGDDRIRYVRLSRNGGACRARNVGIECANGTFLAFLDDDDVFFPDKLEKQVAVLRDAPEEVGLVYSSVEVDLGNGLEVQMPARPASGDIYHEVLSGLWFHTASTLVRAVDDPRWDEAMPRFQDLDFHLSILGERSAIYVPGPVAVWYSDHDEFRITQDVEALERGARRLEQRHYVPHHDVRTARAHRDLLVFVGANLIGRDRRRARAYFREALEAAPGVRAWSFYLATFVPYAWVRILRTTWFRAKIAYRHLARAFLPASVRR